MLPRFFAPDLDPSLSEQVLTAEESRHLSRVLRMRAGEEVALFDGRGREYRAVVVEPRSARARVRLVEQLETVAEPRVAITLVQGVLKADAMDSVVRDATMLGAHTIAPVVTAHTAVSPRQLGHGRAAVRWHRIAVASAKQCRRTVVPAVMEPRPFEAWLASREPDLSLIFVEPSAVRGGEASLRQCLGEPSHDKVTLIVGPEGGWSRAELDEAVAAGCRPVTLGGLTLRADAVPIISLAVVRFVLDW